MISTDPQDTKPAPITLLTDPKGITMVYVPAGKFLMGSLLQQVDEAYRQAKNHYREDIAEYDSFINQMPQHEQVIQRAFWLDLTPITNASYARFVTEGGYKTREFWTDAGWKWVQVVKRTGPTDSPDRSNTPDQPRIGVTWFEAYAYCQWRGGQLPTEAEWEWAARGPENLIYPWGNTFDANRVICSENSEHKTAAVGAGIRGAGASWVGALDMAGNVREWVSSLYRPYPYKADDGHESNNDSDNPRVLRGGWWGSIASRLRSGYRAYGKPTYESHVDGFRCVHF